MTARLGPSVFDRNPIARLLTPRPIPRPHWAWTDTREGRILNPAVIGAPGTDEGIAAGTDMSSRAAYYGDVFTRYEARTLLNPNVIIVGPVGAGKSVLAKTQYVLRQLMLARRQAVILDMKARGDDGDSEYGEPTRYLGGEPFLMWPDHPDCTRMNPLDPVVLAGGGAAAAAGLLGAFAELGGIGPLDADGQDALTVAHRIILAQFEDANRPPVLPELIDMMPTVVDAPAYKGWASLAVRDRIDAAAFDVQTRLKRAVADDVRGMFDGETSPELGLRRKLTTFNICNLPKRGPAMPMVMAVVHAWLMGTLSRNPQRWRTTLVMEEAWAYDAVAREIRSNEKLARGLGLSNLGILQHLSDAPPGTDGEALIREAGTAHIFRQEQDTDLDDCIRTFGLNPANRELLRTLPTGEHLLKVGTAREVHLRGHITPTEYRITETDEAMKGNL